jgi:hypothetical protein
MAGNRFNPPEVTAMPHLHRYLMMRNLDKSIAVQFADTQD